MEFFEKESGLLAGRGMPDEGSEGYVNVDVDVVVNVNGFFFWLLCCTVKIRKIRNPVSHSGLHVNTSVRRSVGRHS
jgi:hypothetical protein